ncbi:MAG: hypothetical protein J6U92_01820 [Clostridia bacterium]|nr:hypothetical protein [Clostridia bacterium]
MSQLKWNLEVDEIGIYDKDMQTALVFSKDNGITYITPDDEFSIDLDEIHHVLMDEPKLFKKGMIAFFSGEGEVLNCSSDDIDVPIVVQVNKKFKGPFYLMFSVLEDNGVELSLG